LRFNTVYLFPHAETLRLITGLPFYTGSFVRLGERGYNMERLYNFREGLTGKDDSLPDRLTKTPQDTSNPKTVVSLDKMLPVYYRIRGWDESGAPRKRTLKKLGIKL
jgi:aldehyde:ferredoxin oxidoreductase